MSASDLLLVVIGILGLVAFPYGYRRFSVVTKEVGARRIAREASGEPMSDEERGVRRAGIVWAIVMLLGLACLAAAAQILILALLGRWP